MEIQTWADNMKTISGIACPQCGGNTQLRSGRYGEFYGCAKYPACRGSVSVVKMRNSSAYLRSNTRVDPDDAYASEDMYNNEHYYE